MGSYMLDLTQQNMELIKWFKTAMQKGYTPCISVHGICELIDSIVRWYELKYPYRDIQKLEGTTYLDFADIPSITDALDVRQLLYRLPDEQAELLLARYHSSNGGFVKNIIDEHNSTIGYQQMIGVLIKRKHYHETFECGHLEGPEFYIMIDANNGQIENFIGSEDYVAKGTKIEELLSIFMKECVNDLNFEQLKQVLFNHQCDIELRKRILDFVALKLLYSREMCFANCVRTKHFIDDFNAYFNIKLNSKEIDDIMEANYAYVKCYGGNHER